LEIPALAAEQSSITQLLDLLADQTIPKLQVQLVVSASGWKLHQVDGIRYLVIHR
jgi:hypothetical protein